MTASILELIPETGIGETALAVAAGLKLSEIRSQLNLLIRKRAIEPVPDLPYHYRPVMVKTPDSQEILDLLAAEKMEAMEIAMELGCGAAQTSAILKQMASRGEIIQKGDYWELNNGNDAFSSGIDINFTEIGSDDDEPFDSSETSGRVLVQESQQSIGSGIESLNDDEIQRRHHLERQVERSFYQAGKALAELRDSRLYRDRWHNWEDYIADRFGFKRNYANKQIAAAEVVDNLIQNYEVQGTNRTLSVTLTGTLPTAETQVRPLIALDPSDRATVWKLAVDKATGKVPTEKLVKETVKEFLNREAVSNPYRVGQVVTIKGKKGWFVVFHIGEFTCTCRDITGKEIIERHFDLKEIVLPSEQRQFAVGLQVRLEELWLKGDQLPSQVDGDTIKALVVSVGSNACGFLTDFQEQLLQLAELQSQGEL